MIQHSDEVSQPEALACERTSALGEFAQTSPYWSVTQAVLWLYARDHKRVLQLTTAQEAPTPYCVMAVSAIRTESAFFETFRQAESELLHALEEGAITAMASPNGLGDPIPIPRTHWHNARITSDPDHADVVIRRPLNNATVWVNPFVESRLVRAMYPEPDQFESWLQEHSADDTWTISQGAFLLAQLVPPDELFEPAVNHEMIFSRVRSPVARDIAERALRLAKDATRKAGGDLEHEGTRDGLIRNKRVSPPAFIKWAKKNGFQIPSTLDSLLAVETCHSTSAQKILEPTLPDRKNALKKDTQQAFREMVIRDQRLPSTAALLGYMMENKERFCILRNPPGAVKWRGARNKEKETSFHTFETSASELRTAWGAANPMLSGALRSPGSPD